MRMARPWSRVHTSSQPVLHPVGPHEASASSPNSWTVITGPKTSCWTISSSWRRPSTTVGAKQ